jgi:hypothetical protein
LPFLLGHPQAVADLGADAAARLNLSAADCAAVRRAGMTGGFGRLGVSNAYSRRAPTVAAVSFEAPWRWWGIPQKPMPGSPVPTTVMSLSYCIRWMRHWPSSPLRYSSV